MAYDEGLADRLRLTLTKRRGVTEKKMFGGIAFLLHGNMAVGIVGNDLMVRVEREKTDAVAAEVHARPMDFSGKPMKGFVYVSAKGVGTPSALRKWVDRGVTVAAALPKKARKKKR